MKTETKEKWADKLARMQVGQVGAAMVVNYDPDGKGTPNPCLVINNRLWSIRQALDGIANVSNLRQFVAEWENWGKQPTDPAPAARPVLVTQPVTLAPKVAIPVLQVKPKAGRKMVAVAPTPDIEAQRAALQAALDALNGGGRLNPAVAA